MHSKSPLPRRSYHFRGLKRELSTETTPTGVTQYLVGYYISYHEAFERKKQLSGMGYQDSFIVGYLNDERLNIPIQQLIQIADSYGQNTSTQASASSRRQTSYRASYYNR